MLKEIYLKLFNSGNSRSLKAKRNIFMSLAIRGGSIIIGLIYVPLLLDVFDKERYGVWLTVSSMVLWFNFLDLGLGNGFRNKFAEALANNNYQLAREYVSTIYFSLGFISLLLTPVFLTVNSFLNWTALLNTNVVSNNDLFILTNIVFLSFIFRFVLQLIGQILTADQRPSINGFFGLISSILSLILIYYFGKMHHNNSLPFMGLILSFSPIFVLFIANIFFFQSSYKQFKPKIKYFKFTHIRSLLVLGIYFFLIQATMVVINFSTNFLIARFCSIQDVTVYNVVQRLFAVTTMIFTIVLSPIWSAITEAYVKGEFLWIKNAMSKLFKLASLLSILTIFILIFSKVIVKIWIGDRLVVPISLCMIEALRTLIYMFFGPFITFLNGVSKIRLGFYLTIFETLVYLPLAYYLSVILSLGVLGILLASILVEVPLRICQPIQYFKIINNSAHGIWNR